MTEFEIIKNALTRVETDVKIYNSSSSFKSIHIPVNSVFGNNVELELEFDKEGELISIFTLD